MNPENPQMLFVFCKDYNYPSACYDQHAGIFSTALSKVNRLINWFFLMRSLGSENIQKFCVASGTQALHAAREMSALQEDSGDLRA